MGYTETLVEVRSILNVKSTVNEWYKMFGNDIFKYRRKTNRAYLGKK